MISSGRIGKKERNKMLSKQMIYNLENSSAIRKMFIEGQELAERVGAENVYDFSLGNPVAPVPPEFNQALVKLVQSEDSLSLHGYMNNAGYPEVRQAVADHLNRRYGQKLTYENIELDYTIMFDTDMKLAGFSMEPQD